MTPAAILSVLVKADGIARAQRDLQGFDKSVERTSKKGSSHLVSLGKTAKWLAGPAAFGAAALGVKAVTDQFYESNRIAKQTDQVLRSTGGAAKVTAKHVNDLANAISRKTGIDDEAIQSGENLLLTFTNIRNEAGKGNKIFDQATSAITDMSAAMGQDMKSSAIQVGKALNDPVKGVTALQRVGVTFTAKQKEQIKSLVEHGKTLEAQKMILHELNKEFGGSAKAQATNMDKLKVSFGNLQESIGKMLVPILEKAAGWLAKFFDQMQSGKGAGGQFVAVLKDIGGWLKQAFENAVPVIGSVVGAIKDSIPTISTIFGVLKDAVVVAFGVIKSVVQALVPIVVAVFNAIKSAVPSVVGAFNAIKGAIGAAVEWIKGATNTVIGEVSQWDTLWSAIGRGFDLVKAGAKLMFAVLKVAFSAGLAALGPIVTAAWTLIKGIFSGAFTAIKGIVTGGFDVLRGVVKIIGGLFKGDFGQIWDGIKTIFSGGIKALKGILEGAWKILKAPVDAIGDGLHDAFKNTWDRIKGLFQSSINAVIDFLNLLIKAINVIPGVPDIKLIGHIGGGGGDNSQKQQNLGKTGHLARGGAYARTGGLVNQPITLMGEEAPRYPEFVIPTNPAYRGRARGLLAQAAGAVGMASGGVFSQGDIMDLWTGQHGDPARKLIASAIAMAESGGRAGATSANPAGGSNLGLWQIWSGNPGATLDPAGNARAAINLSRNGSNWSLWETFVNGAYKQFLGKGRAGGMQGGLPSVGDVVGSFPKVTKAMGMFGGLGKYVIGKATGYVKKQIAGLFQGQGNLGNKGVNSGLSLGVQKAIALATGMGWAYPSFGQLTGGGHVQGSLHYQGRAVDFGTAGHSPDQVMGLWQALINKFGLGMNELFYDPAGRYIDAHKWHSGAIGGHGDHIHVGFRKGGKWLGSFKNGGITGAEGLAHLHANEMIVPLKKGGKHMKGPKLPASGANPFGKASVSIGGGRFVTVEQYAQMIANGYDPSNTDRSFGPFTQVPDYSNVTPPASQLDYLTAALSKSRLTKGLDDDLKATLNLQSYRKTQYQNALASGDPRQISQAADDLASVNDAVDSLREEISQANEIARQKNELDKQIKTNQDKILALANQGPEILAAVVAAVNGGIGGNVGLGFQSPSYSGGMARYR